MAISLPKKHPKECISYTFNLLPDKGLAAETLTQAATYYVFDDSAAITDSNNLASSMIAATAYDNTNKTITADVQGGTDGKSYYLVAKITVAATPRIYVKIGRFQVEDENITASAIS